MNIKFCRDGKEIGDYPEEAVPALLQSNVLNHGDFFWHEGLPDWKAVASRWPIPAPPPLPARTDERYKRELKAALAEGYIILSEGPSGAQLERPKKMTTQMRTALTIGFLLLLAWGVGLIIIIAVLIDYAMQKKQTVFVSRL